MIFLTPYISFCSFGDRLFLMNHKTGAELFLNSDAAQIIRLIDAGKPLPDGIDDFVGDLQKMGIVEKETSSKSERFSPENGEDLHLFEQVKAEATQKLRPFSAHLEITRRCPLACDHCYLRDVPTEGDKELSTDEWILLIDSLHKMGAFHLSVTGGEPFVRDDAVEILTAIRKRRMALSVLSSGAGVSDSIAKQIADISPMVWQTSIYGDEKTHDSLTGVSGSFAQMLHVARYMKQRGVSVRMTAVITSESLYYIDYIKELCLVEGFVLSFNTTLMPGLGGTEPPRELRLSDAELQRLFEKIECQQSPPIPLTSPPCDAARSVVAINHRGDLYPCIEWRESAGNITKDSIENIWKNSSFFQEIRNITQSDILECQSCEFQHFCHRCPGHAVRQGHTMIQKDEWACRKAKSCATAEKQLQ